MQTESIRNQVNDLKQKLLTSVYDLLKSKGNSVDVIEDASLSLCYPEELPLYVKKISVDGYGGVVELIDNDHYEPEGYSIITRDIDELEIEELLRLHEYLETGLC
jgi:hypothetical protein